MGKGIKTAGKVARGITTAAVGIGAAAFAMTKKVTSGFDDIAKNARKMGISTDYYQEMEYWASQNGLSHENMEKSMKRLNQRLGQAVEGNEKYSNALTRLGVDLKEVEKGNVSTEQAMTQSIQALSEMENSQQKAALAADLFGVKLAQELMPTLDKGALSIEEAQKKAEELGIVIAEDTLNAAEEFNDTWDDLTRMMTAFSQKVLAQLMPVFQTMMDWVIAHMPQIQAIFQMVFDGIGFMFNTSVEWIQSLISWLNDWRESNNEILSGIWESLQTYLGLVLEYWMTIWELISSFWQENGESILNTAIEIFMEIYETVQWAFEHVWTIIQHVLDLVVPFIQEQLGKILSFWKENGSQIMDAVKNAFNFIKGVIDFVMPAILFIIETVWKNISGFISGTLDVIMGLIKTFSGLLTGDWSKMWEGVKQLVSGALTAVWNLLNLTLLGRAVGLIRGFGTTAVNLFRNMGTGAVNAVRSMGTNAINAVNNLISRITGSFTKLPGMALQWGKNMLKGFVDGIKSMGSAVKNAASSVVSGVKGFLGFSSPAEEGEGRYIVEWGRNMVDGFLDGVKSETAEAGQVMNQLLGAMSSQVIPPVKPMSTVGESGTTQTVEENSVYEFHIEIPLDGREFIKRTIRMTAEELERFKRRNRGD